MARQNDDKCTLGQVEQQRSRRQTLSSGAQHIRGANVARTYRAQITCAGKAGQDQAKGYRTANISGDDGEQWGRDDIHKYRLSRHCEQKGEGAFLFGSTLDTSGAMNAEPDPASPILLFDSGVGGLSVLTKLRAILPDAPILYAADNGGLPYGSKSEAQIAARVSGLLGRMTERFRPRLVCIACNTASTIALASVREVLEVPIVGTVPAIKPAAAMTRTGVIGLLGTEATIRQGYVDRLEAEFASDKRLLRHAAPELVAAAESRLRGDVVDGAVFSRAAQALRAMPGGEAIDTVVLACTHFPLVQAELATAFGPGVTFVDGSDGIARRIAYLTDGQQFVRKGPDTALFTRDGDDLEALRSNLAAHGLERIVTF